jgi:hypothetical protein
MAAPAVTPAANTADRRSLRRSTSVTAHQAATGTSLIGTRTCIRNAGLVARRTAADRPTAGPASLAPMRYVINTASPPSSGTT